MLTRRSEIGREAHPEVREESGGPPGGPRGVRRLTCRGLDRVGRPTRRSEIDRKVHPEVQVVLGGPPRGSQEVLSPTRRSGRDCKSHTKVLEWPGVHPKVQ